MEYFRLTGCNSFIQFLHIVSASQSLHSLCLRGVASHTLGLPKKFEFMFMQPDGENSKKPGHR